VSEPAPTPLEAQAALVEANSQAARVRRADHQLGWMLLGIAAVYLAAAGVISTLPDLRRGGPVAGLAIVAILIVGSVVFIVVGLRIRAYSRTGILLYFGGVTVFNVWNAIVAGVSIGTRWWARTQPSYHFGLSELVGAIPLLVAAWLIGRR
jgi:hypothetical protein